tara:strand:- start:1029 stop:1298 length:270 start_codon:yes stop_codon:yes gene_type:complete
MPLLRVKMHVNATPVMDSDRMNIQGFVICVPDPVTRHTLVTLGVIIVEAQLTKTGQLAVQQLNLNTTVNTLKKSIKIVINGEQISIPAT